MIKPQVEAVPIFNNNSTYLTAKHLRDRLQGLSLFQDPLLLNHLPLI